jgi:hypothetical protein
MPVLAAARCNDSAVIAPRRRTGTPGRSRPFEGHRGESGFDHDRLGELVRHALIGQGRQPDAEAIEEAIWGMAGYLGVTLSASND